MTALRHAHSFSAAGRQWSLDQIAFLLVLYSTEIFIQQWYQSRNTNTDTILCLSGDSTNQCMKRFYGRRPCSHLYYSRMKWPLKGMRFTTIPGWNMYIGTESVCMSIMLDIFPQKAFTVWSLIFSWFQNLQTMHTTVEASLTARNPEIPNRYNMEMKDHTEAWSQMCLLANSLHCGMSWTTLHVVSRWPNLHSMLPIEGIV